MPRLSLIRLLSASAIVVGLSLVLYLSWLEDSKMTQVSWIPAWISEWADRNGTIRTGVPFVFLGVVFAGCLQEERVRRWHWLAAIGLMVAVVAVAELGQVGLPDRTASWIDVGWGAAGGAVGLGIGRAVLCTISWLRRVLLVRRGTQPGPPMA